MVKYYLRTNNKNQTMTVQQGEDRGAALYTVSGFSAPAKEQKIQ